MSSLSSSDKRNKCLMSTK